MCYNPNIVYCLLNTMATGIIYLAKNTVSGKCYVGKTTRTLEQRKKEHYRDTIKEDYKFGRALQKYKKTDWEWTVLAEVFLEELEENEIFFIKDLDTFKNGYNTLTGEEWKGKGNPRHNSTIYELWHPEHGEIKETLGELYSRSASFGHISELIKGKRFQINGYVLLENKDKYNTIFKKYNFYHPKHGEITCTTMELFRNYSEYFNGKESKIYNLVGDRCKICSGWVLAENKDNYDDLIDTSKPVTLTHPEHGTLTLKTSEFKTRFGLSDSGISFLKSGTYKVSKGWTFTPNNNK